MLRACNAFALNISGHFTAFVGPSDPCAIILQIVGDCISDRTINAMGVTEDMQRRVCPKGVSPKVYIIRTVKVSEYMQSNHEPGRVNPGKMLEFVIETHFE